MDIIWDITNHRFLDSLTNSQELQRFDWILRDTVPVRLYIVNETAAGYVQQEAPAGKTPKFTAKALASLSGDALVFCGAWTLNESGETAYYTADVDLNVTALIAAHEAGKNTSMEWDIRAEFCFQDANGVDYDSTQIDLRIIEDVHRAGEAAPTASTAAWPYLVWYTDENGRHCARITNDLGETLLDLKPPGA